MNSSSACRTTWFVSICLAVEGGMLFPEMALRLLPRLTRVLQLRLNADEETDLVAFLRTL